MHIIGVLALFVASPALASSEWTCTVSDPAHPSAPIQQAAIELKGDLLIWKVGDALPLAPPNLTLTTVSFPHRVLVNNSIGIVAVSANSEVNSYTGRLISADIILVDKKDGRLRISDVGFNSSRVAGTGHCRLKKGD